MSSIELYAKSEQAEKQLAVLYSVSAILSTTSTICLLIVWQHWAWTLDVCISVDCGCILYGVNTFSTFMGGDVKLCHFTSYGLVPVLIVGLVLAIYHGYRTCINRNLGDPKQIQMTSSSDHRAEQGNVVVVGPKRRTICKRWFLAGFLGVFIFFLSLSHAVLLTDGYYKTCNQYRRNMVQLLGSSGREVQVIHNRLSCGAVFDYMDYLQPDANNWRRGDEINTGLSLQLAITTSWFNLFAWIGILTINLLMARERQIDLNGKSCCCW
ncbi:uncharacterized protein [Neodiprion pinetum]|uniref:Uncharacterized protein LOC107225069 n=1 Tax=Neodiprion lecontei TaxID=441921 RepID=A0A6J0C2X8_NEOLC|nr:uncharacterized protein LOC107225069 [Neodiprion lecontei]XP_046465136.1 uncharacterized protein LOC124210807 [Neodiprion pinetum]